MDKITKISTGSIVIAAWMARPTGWKEGLSTRTRRHLHVFRRGYRGDGSGAQKMMRAALEDAEEVESKTGKPISRGSSSKAAERSDSAAT
jgi:hypothetical protein